MEAFIPSITIQGTVIDFPDSAQSPNWATPIIQFAQAVEAALESVAGPFDVPPQVYTMVSNSNSGVSLPSLSFSTSNVRGAFVRYSVYRTTSTTTAYESGNLLLVYNPNGSVGSKWEIARDYVGNGSITFAISDLGQVSFSTTSLSGINHSGFITYVAQALSQT